MYVMSMVSVCGSRGGYSQCVVYTVDILYQVADGGSVHIVDQS